MKCYKFVQKNFSLHMHFKCNKTGHLQSECRNGKPYPRRGKERHHVHHKEQDYEEQMRDQ